MDHRDFVGPVHLLKVLDGALDGGTLTLRRIGDCLGPGIIATAVYEGHRYARELGAEVDAGDVPFRRERLVIEPTTPRWPDTSARPVPSQEINLTRSARFADDFGWRWPKRS